MTRALILCVWLSSVLVACSQQVERQDADADAQGDGDADVDGDTDTDVDGDVDADGDADADRDADEDADADRDADADVDADEDVPADADLDQLPDVDVEEDSDQRIFCNRECDLLGIFNQCEVGDCGWSGDPRDCCVSPLHTCNVTAHLGPTELDVSYRGFYSNDHMCLARRFDSGGEDMLVFVAQTRGAACDPGFIRFQIVVQMDGLPLGESMPLCGATGPRALRVNLSMRDGGVHQTYSNIGCAEPGSFSLEALAGNAYSFMLRGQLQRLDGAEPTGELINVSVDSDGVLALE